MPYFENDKATCRFFGAFSILVTGLLIIPFLGMTLVLGVSLVYTLFNPLQFRVMSYIWLALLLEIFFTFRTMKKEVSGSPAGALQNLPLLCVDLFILTIFSNSILLPLDIPAKEVADLIRGFLMILIFLRYYGLATTNNRNILKRIFCPVRHDVTMMASMI